MAQSQIVNINGNIRKLVLFFNSWQNLWPLHESNTWVIPHGRQKRITLIKLLSTLQTLSEIISLIYNLQGASERTKRGLSRHQFMFEFFNLYFNWIEMKLFCLSCVHLTNFLSYLGLKNTIDCWSKNVQIDVSKLITQDLFAQDNSGHDIDTVIHRMFFMLALYFVLLRGSLLGTYLFNALLKYHIIINYINSRQ